MQKRVLEIGAGNNYQEENATSSYNISHLPKEVNYTANNAENNPCLICSIKAFFSVISCKPFIESSL